MWINFTVPMEDTTPLSQTAITACTGEFVFVFSIPSRLLKIVRTQHGTIGLYDVRGLAKVQGRILNP